MSKSKSGYPSIEQSLPMALIRAREKLMLPIREMLSKSGITEQQWRVLRALDEYGPMDLTNLSEISCILASSQSRIVETLLQKGFVTREQDVKDRRRITVTITDKGSALLKDNVQQARKIAADYRAFLGEDKTDDLLKTLKKLERM